MEKRKKNNIGVPLPKSRDKVFTEKENKMLDQITLEICEAWKNDLINIRSNFNDSKKLNSLLNVIYNQVNNRINCIDEFFDKTGSISSLRDIHQSQLSLESQISEMRSQMLSVHNRLEAKSIDTYIKTINECKDVIVLAMKALEKSELEKKKWWKFW